MHSRDDALQILNDLLRQARLAPSKVKRLDLTLACAGRREGYAALPADDFCASWFFAVGPHFSAALDIRLDKRKRNKKSYYIWTQGSAFAFQVGYQCQTRDGSTLVQVQSASSAGVQNNGARNAGSVGVQVYKPGPKPGTWEKSDFLRMSQDEFVAFLITGLAP